MCLFPYPNYDMRSKTYRYGITEFACGACPECLAKRASLWALRATMEAKYNIGMMLTLTYDQYERDENGRIIGEKPADTRELSKRDCQLFIKRLRKHFDGVRLKYIIGAEHGKRTGRSHYHAVIFGAQFDDCTPYKKSKRGNQTYLSKTLKEIWGHGICTVDSLNISASIARYCTKYTAKANGVDDTFMLFSRGIGDRALLERFYDYGNGNGKKRKPLTAYTVEGKKYPIPRTIIKNYIEKKYLIDGYSRYVSMTPAVSYVERVDKIETARALAIEKNVDNFTRRINYWQGVYHNALASYERAKRPATIRARYARVEDLRDRVECLQLSLAKIVNQVNENAENALIKAQAFTESAQYTRYKRARFRRAVYSNIRDNDSVYKRYIAYWARQDSIRKLTEKTAVERLLALDDKRYFRYKSVAYTVMTEQQRGAPYKVPWSKSLSRFLPKFAVSSCLITANDTANLREKALAMCKGKRAFAKYRAKGVTFAETDETSPF